MTDDQRLKCHGIIHAAALSTGAIGAGLAQVPTSDNLIIVPIQVSMVLALGSTFCINKTESSAKATLATVSATLTGRAISQVGIGWMPIIGNLVNASTALIITETIGWAVANSFDK